MSATAIAEEPAVYTMPEVEIGEIVFWYHGADDKRRPVPFVVEACFGDGVDLKGVTSNTWTQLKQGVRHISDPRLANNPEWRKAGAWDYSPVGKRLRQAERDLKRHVADITHLLKQVNELRGKREAKG